MQLLKVSNARHNCQIFVWRVQRSWRRYINLPYASVRRHDILANKLVSFRMNRQAFGTSIDNIDNSQTANAMSKRVNGFSQQLAVSKGNETIRIVCAGPLPAGSERAFYVARTVST
jgi:hypothetical protein